jgi:hypothetical protein
MFLAADSPLLGCSCSLQPGTEEINRPLISGLEFNAHYYVDMLATGHKGSGFKPGRDNGFLRAIKILSIPSLGWEIIPEIPCRKILRHVKNPLRYLR